MFTTYIQSTKKFRWLDEYHCFDNNYLINSDGSSVEKNQFNGSGVYEGEFVSNREDLQNKCETNLSNEDLNRVHFDIRGALTNYIVDRNSKKIFIIPDPIGMSIIYYYITPQLKIYSNSIKEIRRILSKCDIELTKEINYFFESLVMNNGGLGHTPFKEISAIKPFHYIIISENEIQVVENTEIVKYISKIYNPDYRDVISIAKNDIITNLKAVQNYKSNGVKISHLTGGFDSRLILSAILNQNMQDEFIFFCSGRDGTMDTDISKAICKEFGLTFTNYSGYELTKKLNSRIDGFLWSLDYTSGTNYGAHGNYKKRDNIILSGGLGLLYRSVYTLNNPPEYYTNYLQMVKEKWPSLDVNKDTVFKEGFLDLFYKSFMNDVDDVQKYKIPDGSLFDFMHMRYRSRYFTGQVSFFLSATNPRFDVLYSLKSFLNILFLDLKTRKSNLIGLSLLEEFHPKMINYPFDSNKFNREYVELKGLPKTIEFISSEKLKTFENYHKPNLGVSKINKNSREILARANKMKATLWQVEDEQEAKDGLSNIVNNLPQDFKINHLNVDYINKLINNEITNRVQLRRLHDLFRNFIWFK